MTDETVVANEQHISVPWEGQEVMGERLVREALGDSGVVFLPSDDRLMVFPVIADETRPVDLTVIQMGGQDLPEIGVVVEVGWLVNEKAVAEMASLQAKAKGKKSTDTRLALLRIDAIQRFQFYGAGDIVAINKFSGMDVPGTNFLLCSRRDVLGKLLNFPVVLRSEQGRWDQIQEAHAADVAEGEVASKKIVTALR